MLRRLELPPSGRRHVKVCFITGTLGRGGAERQLVYMLKALAGQPVDTRVLSLTEGEPLQSEIENLGIRIESVGANPSRPTRLAAIVRALRHDRVDVVQSTHFYTNLYATVAADLSGAKSIGTVRGNLHEGLRANPFAGWADLYLPDFLVVNSRLAHRSALALGRSPRRVFLVQNAVDGSRFESGAIRKRGPKPDSLHLLFVGRLTQEKRADRFLRIVARACSEFPDRNIEARLVGDGPDRTDLEALRSSLALDPSRVQFTGEIEDTVPLYSWADVLVLTSDHEGTPNVILEAMASGLPVVATAVGGVPELLCHGGGLLARPNSDESLYTALKKLTTDIPLTRVVIAEGVRYVARNHSVERLQAQLNVVYKTVTGRRVAQGGNP